MRTPRHARRPLHLLPLLLSAFALPAQIRVAPWFGDHMVLQRERPVAIGGDAMPGERISVRFAEQELTTRADAHGRWEVRLAPLPAHTPGRTLAITGATMLAFHDVLVGDVWLCSGQSNMDMRLADCQRPADVASAEFPVLRHFTVPMRRATAAKVPIGLVLAAVGGSTIEPWLAPEGIVDVPELHPLLAQGERARGAFALFHGMIAPLAGQRLRGLLWYQGENAETAPLAPDGYFLEMKALATGWRRVFGGDDLAFYFVMIANQGAEPTGPTPVLQGGGWNADTRLQQTRALALPHSGMASALDIGDSSVGERIWAARGANQRGTQHSGKGRSLRGSVRTADVERPWKPQAMLLPSRPQGSGRDARSDLGCGQPRRPRWDGWHPRDKLDVGERLALWARRNEYGESDLVACGPVVRDVTREGAVAVCTFDHAEGGLMVATKRWYEPTEEVPGGKLARFVLAGADGVWHAADAVIVDDTVRVSAPGVALPTSVAYACWQNPRGCNLYGKSGLPAAPFLVSAIGTHHTITASAGEGGTLSLPGTSSHLPSATAGCAITPAPGWSIEDVRVDGVPVGAVRHFTFDPLHADHTIAATFTKTAPTCTVRIAAGPGGSVTPNGALRVAQGGTVELAIAPDAGNRPSLVVDGVMLGARENFAFPDLRADHVAHVEFACPVTATAGYGGALAPSGVLLVPHGAPQAFSITALAGFEVAGVRVDGRELGAIATHAFAAVTGSHEVEARFRRTQPRAGSIPRPEALLLACRAADLGDEGKCATWPTQVPKGGRVTALGSPRVVRLAGRPFVSLTTGEAPGFAVAQHSQPLPCAGATLVVVARPERTGVPTPWTALVDVFYDRLVLGIRGDTGQVCVRRNGSIDVSTAAIPDRQITILSLVVQADGTFTVHANGAEVLASRTASPLRSLVPGGAGPFAHAITLGRNAPDAWTGFHGQIGDVFLYGVALDTGEREDLEALLAATLEGR